MISEETRDRLTQSALDRLSVNVHHEHGVTLAGVVVPGEFTIQLTAFDIVPKSGEIKAQRALAQLCLLADARQYSIEGGVNQLFPSFEDRYERVYTAFGFTAPDGGLRPFAFRREPDPSGTHEHRTRRVSAVEVKTGDIVRQVVIDRHGSVQWHTVKRTSHHPYGVAHIEFESTTGFYWTLPAQRTVTIEDLN
ncbi:hypothetical protein [Glycomyces sp. NPDC047010]|uniref:hypothetical protein n=1 Tax=Glycomyces sp. NPDC047010 TaxID=3155023 RepID=UPI0033DD20BB